MIETLTPAQRIIWGVLRRTIPPCSGFDYHTAVAAAEIDKALGGLTRRWGGTDPEYSDTEPFGYYEGGGPDVHYADVFNRECAAIDADEYGGNILFGWSSGWLEVTE